MRGKYGKRKENQIIKEQEKIESLFEDAKSIEEVESISLNSIDDAKKDDTITSIKDAALEKIAGLAEVKKKESKTLNDEILELKTTKEGIEKEIERMTPLKDEINSLEKQKDGLILEIADKNDAIKSLDEDIQSKEKQKTNLDQEIEKKKQEKQEVISSTKKDAKLAAQKERMDIIGQAYNEALDNWNKNCESLKSKIDDLMSKEELLNNKEISLKKKEQQLQLKEEDLQADMNYVNGLKQKYNQYSPTEVEKLKLELESKESYIKTLKDNNNDFLNRNSTLKIELDNIKAQLEIEGESHITTAMDVVDRMLQLKKENDMMKTSFEKYKDYDLDELIRNDVTYKKERQEWDILLDELNNYKARIAEIENYEKEAKVLRKKIEASNALNESLIKELESHKTALESRTGDTCPSLTRVDEETKDDDKKIYRERFPESEIKSLKELVDYIKDFAASGNCKKGEHFNYKREDIMAYIAGMAVSRLIILQGMSGTGKSSLPEIIKEAIKGECVLVPVESSWRDRNELLGYYNDFNKKFNAKTFTIELYRFSKVVKQNVPTFMVLDEMNLARVEYYFSDFLSVLERDKDDWMIELVSTDMRTLPIKLSEKDKKRLEAMDSSPVDIWEKIENSRKGDLKSEISDKDKERLRNALEEIGCLVGAKELVDGRKIKISDNIWFVGTANKDESTFEITDKVYDRAQVINLDSPANLIGKDSIQNVPIKFISNTKLKALFSVAKEDKEIKKFVDKELDALKQELENFKISFGNRIIKQAEEFAQVFVAAGNSKEKDESSKNKIKALDYQISTKIIRKVLLMDKSEKEFSDLKTWLDNRNYSMSAELIKDKIDELNRE